MSRDITISKSCGTIISQRQAYYLWLQKKPIKSKCKWTMIELWTLQCVAHKAWCGMVCSWVCAYPSLSHLHFRFSHFLTMNVNNMVQHGTVSSLKLQQQSMTYFDDSFLSSLLSALSYSRSCYASSSLLPPLSTILITNPQSVTIQKWLAAVVPILCTLSRYAFTFQVIRNKHIIVSQYLAELMREMTMDSPACVAMKIDVTCRATRFSLSSSSSPRSSVISLLEAIHTERHSLTPVHPCRTWSTYTLIHTQWALLIQHDKMSMLQPGKLHPYHLIALSLMLTDPYCMHIYWAH